MNESSRRDCHKAQAGHQAFENQEEHSWEKKHERKPVILLYEEFAKENVVIVLTKGKTSYTCRYRYQQSTLGRGMCSTEIPPEHLKNKENR